MLLACLAVPRAAVPAPVQTAPLAVTTDSLSYCNGLARRVLPASSSAAAVRLAREGAAMCEGGHLRVGIMQLRRALLLTRGGRAPSP